MSDELEAFYHKRPMPSETTIPKDYLNKFIKDLTETEEMIKMNHPQTNSTTPTNPTSPSILKVMDQLTTLVTTLSPTSLRVTGKLDDKYVYSIDIDIPEED
jgi:hypothetical protein